MPELNARPSATGRAVKRPSSFSISIANTLQFQSFARPIVGYTPLQKLEEELKRELGIIRAAVEATKDKNDYIAAHNKMMGVDHWLELLANTNDIAILLI